MWSRQGPIVWRTERFEGSPSFYPVYRHEDLYSYSPLALILAKGRLDLDTGFAARADGRDFLYASGSTSIDRGIERLGGAVVGTGQLRDADSYASAMTAAMIADTKAIEDLHPGGTNILLCGGRDSMNMVMLPWKNRTIVVSAPPNHTLVEEFVRGNDLDREVVRLDDPRDPDVLEDEILHNACRLNLEHARWGAHLRQLGQEHGPDTVFWKGQLLDLYASNKWIAVSHPPTGPHVFLKKVYKRTGHLLPAGLQRRVADQWLEPDFRRTLWLRGAAWQRAHVSLVRAITDRLVLSCYHGPRMTGVFRDVDLLLAATRDMRPEVGRRLLGREVFYPEANPSPPPSTFRRGLCRSSGFLQRLEDGGVAITR
jgi:hypothetical protein